jgi:hypothetical protein
MAVDDVIRVTCDLCGKREVSEYGHALPYGWHRITIERYGKHGFVDSVGAREVHVCDKHSDATLGALLAIKPPASR